MTSEHGGESITSILHETRVFPPPPEFARQAHIASLEQYEAMWQRAKDDPEGFWGEMAGASLDRALERGARLAAAVREVVCRREAERRTELCRSALRRAAQEQGGDPLGR